MYANRLIRFIRKRRQTFLVWAMLPLSILNVQTIVGCGCTGHFEAVCHCGSCDVESSGPASGARLNCGSNDLPARSCCCKVLKPDTQEQSTSALSHNSNGLRTHHCQKIWVQVGESMGPRSFELQHDLSMWFSPNAPSFLLGSSLMRSEPLFAFDTGPPKTDVVIALCRLVI